MSNTSSGVPPHWETITLKEIAEVRLGRQRSPERATGDHMRPYMRAANVTRSGISLHDVKEMDFTPQEFATYGLRRGDILLAEASGSASEVGKPAIWNGEVPNCCFQNTLLRVRTDESLVPFLHLHFTKDVATGAFAAASRGVGIHHLGAQAMCEWTIRLPPLGEQNRIVEAIESYFTRLDDAVATLERVERNLKRYRASVLKSAVEGRLVPTEAALAKQEGRDYESASMLLERILAERRRRWSESGHEGKYQEPVPPDTTSLPELPAGWCWASVDQVGDVSGGVTKNAKRDALPCSLPYLRVANVYANELRLDELKEIGLTEREIERVLLRKDDLLIVEGNGSLDQIGRVALWDGSVDPCVHQNHLIKIRFSEGSLPGWALTWLLSPNGRLAIQRAASSTSGLHTLSISKIGRLPIPLCPSLECVRISAAVARSMSLLRAAEQSTQVDRRRCTRLHEALLKWAFEGKLVDQDPNDEPASVLLERIKAERESVKPGKANGSQRSTRKKQVRA